MTPPPLLLTGVLGATAARMALGALWYSPLLFLGPWKKIAGLSDARMKAEFPKAIAVDAVGSFLSAFVLVHAIYYAGANTVPLGMAVGFLNWLGFVAFIQFGATTYEGKPLRYALINAGYTLVTFVVMGAILTAFGLAWPAPAGS